MKFSELGLSKPLLEAIEKQNYVEMTPIQEMAIPHILNNKDIIGVAQTGTGKTAAFSLPILEKLILQNNPNKKIKVLILSPTRELALQIKDNIRNYSSQTDFKCSVILGGVNQQSQKDVLKKGVDILVATPGRLLDLVKRNYANLSNVEMLVLDEADTMLDMGFIKDVKQIIARTPSTRQTMLFSATMSKEVNELANDFLVNPVTVKASPISSAAPKISQLLYYVDRSNKCNLLIDLFNNLDMKSTLIFTRTKHGANKLEDQLLQYKIKCSVIHGNKSQNVRVKSLNDFKTGQTNILIATDIAARGIDINELSHVINYDMPDHPEVYVHRIGRTARAGLEGTAISLCSHDEKKQLALIEKLIKTQIDIEDDHNYPLKDFTEAVKKAPTNRPRRPISSKSSSTKKPNEYNKRGTAKTNEFGKKSSFKPKEYGKKTTSKFGASNRFSKNSSSKTNMYNKKRG